MLGLSLGKLIVLIVIILVVWYGFKYVQRVEEVRRVLRAERNQRRQAASQRASVRQAEDLVKCGPCGAYVAAHSTSPCSREDCPWGR
jgi:ribosomal protein L32